MQPGKKDFLAHASSTAPRLSDDFIHAFLLSDVNGK